MAISSRRERALRRNSPKATGSRSSRQGKEAEDMELYDVKIASRLLLGTAQYPSPAILADAVRAASVDIVTVSLRRESGRLREGQDFWSLIRALGIRVLPNTAGCHSVREAVTTAQM